MSQAHGIEHRAGMPPLAIVAGMRTPFAKAFGPLHKLNADVLGEIAVAGALERAGIKPDQVDEVIFGNVSGQPDASNVARVISLRSGIPESSVAHTVNRNCASGMEAVISAWQAVRDGRSRIVLAGGTESMSNVPLLWDRRMQAILIDLALAKSWTQKLGILSRIRPAFLKPVPALQLGLTDPTCGLNMGQTAEKLAREFSISRDAQDGFALASHRRALAAWERCFYKGEVIPISAAQNGGTELMKDSGPRTGQSLEALARLRPFFEKNGTVTVGNSCPITDGAAAVIVMPADQASAEGREPLGYLRGYAIAGCDPTRMGLGPVFAISRLLEQSGLSLRDFDLFEINEAFAAQVLSCVAAMSSDEFAKRELNRSHAIGEVDREKLNVNGGAIALGHPVGTSGTRLILTLLRALRERKLRRGIASLCVGGGQGAAVWVETALD